VVTRTNYSFGAHCDESSRAKCVLEGTYLLPRSYLLVFVLLCLGCQNKQSCWRIKAKSAVQHRGLKTLGFERNEWGGGRGEQIHLDTSAKSCPSVHIKTQTLRLLLAAYPAPLASLDNRNQFCTAQATVPFALFQDL
jgi:hypothetical protein